MFGKLFKKKEDPMRGLKPDDMERALEVLNDDEKEALMTELANKKGEPGPVFREMVFRTAALGMVMKAFEKVTGDTPASESRITEEIVNEAIKIANDLDGLDLGDEERTDNKERFIKLLRFGNEPSYLWFKELVSNGVPPYFPQEKRGVVTRETVTVLMNLFRAMPDKIKPMMKKEVEAFMGRPVEELELAVHEVSAKFHSEVLGIPPQSVFVDYMKSKSEPTDADKEEIGGMLEKLGQMGIGIGKLDLSVSSHFLGKGMMTNVEKIKAIHRDGGDIEEARRLFNLCVKGFFLIYAWTFIYE